MNVGLVHYSLIWVIHHILLIVVALLLKFVFPIMMKLNILEVQKMIVQNTINGGRNSIVVAKDIGIWISEK